MSEVSCQWQIFLSTLCFCTKINDLRCTVLQWQQHNTSKETVVDTLEKYQDWRLKNSGRDYVLKCLGFLQTIPPTTESIAKSWVYLGLLRILLLLPSSPLDPSQKQMLKQQANNTHIKKVTHTLDVKESSERVWSGGLAVHDPISIEVKSDIERMTQLNNKLQEKNSISTGQRFTIP